MADEPRILAVNPGSTSTKVAVYAGERCIADLTVRHERNEFSSYATLVDQQPARTAAVRQALDEAGVAVQSLSATVGRGGLLFPLTGGTYRVDKRMLDDLSAGVLGSHASNLGGIIANEIASEAGGVPAFIVDPVVVDERVSEARLSGVPEFDRVSIFHALNQKAVARRLARDLHRKYEALNLVIAHLGGGITVGTHRHGRVIDVNDGLNGEGPFSPERSGGLAALKLVDWCFSGDATEAEIRNRIKGGGGLYAYLGTSDAREVSRRIDDGDATAERVYRAMAWQIAREIGAAAAALGTRPDAVVMTGGLAHDSRLTGWISDQIGWLADVYIYPGEDEMLALAEGALRVLRGEETEKRYTGDDLQ